MMLKVRFTGSLKGFYSITELVTKQGMPVQRKVRLCDQLSGRLVEEKWSDELTGLVTFEGLHRGPWVVYALDHLGEFEAVIIQNRIATEDGLRPPV